MTFGKTPASRITDPNTVNEIINVFGSHGYKELGKGYRQCYSKVLPIVT